jgi:hypothetical protein
MLKESGLPNMLAPRGFAKGIHNIGSDSVDRIFKGYKHQAIRGGDESLLLWPVKALASKILPKKFRRNVRALGWDYLGKPALRLDTAVGGALEKIPLIGKSLFRTKEQIPWGHGLQKEVTRSSAFAPLSKVRDVAEPILVGVGLEKGFKKLKNMRQPEAAAQDQQLREKVASVMLSLHEKNKGHEKRAHAERLLFKQVEMGLMQSPQSHSELETKLAALVTEDLTVLEKALELTGGNVKLGELSLADPSAAVSPVEKFQATILGNEF